jgi:hypothetical protein
MFVSLILIFFSILPIHLYILTSRVSFVVLRCIEFLFVNDMSSKWYKKENHHENFTLFIGIVFSCLSFLLFKY